MKIDWTISVKMVMYVAWSRFYWYRSCFKASMLLQNVPPLVLIQFLREHRLNGQIMASMLILLLASLRATPFVVPCVTTKSFFLSHMKRYKLNPRTMAVKPSFQKTNSQLPSSIFVLFFNFFFFVKNLLKRQKKQGS